VAFSSRPGHSLHRHTTAWAVHTPQGVQEVHGHSPQGDELEPPLRQPIVTRPRPTAARADRPAVLAGVQGHFQRRSWCTFQPLDFSVHEGLERFDPIEDSLQLHPVVASGEMVGLVTPSLTGNATGCTYLLTVLPRYTDCCLAKRSRALRGRNPARDSQAEGASMTPNCQDDGREG
jgi:hypothetical protein